MIDGEVPTVPEAISSASWSVVAARMGFRAASTLVDALEMASDTVGTSPSITYLHNPPHMIADVK